MNNDAKWNLYGYSKFEMIKYHADIDKDRCASATIYKVKNGLVVFEEKRIKEQCTYIYVGSKKIELTGIKIEIKYTKKGVEIAVIEGSVSIYEKTYKRGYEEEL